MSELTNYEKETQILFNEAEPTAEVYTINRRLINRLNAISEREPSKCTFIRRDTWGFEWWKVDKQLVTFKMPLTEEARQARSERAKKQFQKGTDDELS